MTDALYPCVYCLEKTDYVTQPDGSVLEVKVPPRHHLCVARWGGVHFCPCFCPWLVDELRGHECSSHRAT